MKSLRKEIHFTQRELAALAGKSQSCISMSEKGHRGLADTVTDKLNELHLLSQRAGKQKTIFDKTQVAAPANQYSKLEKRLRSDMRNANEEAVRTSLALSRMREIYEAMAKKLALINLLKEDAEPASGQLAYLKVLEDKTLEKLERNSTVRQLELRYKLAMASSKMQAASEFLKALKQLA